MAIDQIEKSRVSSDVTDKNNYILNANLPVATSLKQRRDTEKLSMPFPNYHVFEQLLPEVTVP